MLTRSAALLCVVCLPLVAACAAKRPVLYPNAALQHKGRAQAQVDIDSCVQSAEAYGAGTNATGRAATSTAKGAATGAVAGGTYGAVRGNAGSRAAGGAAAGASVGLLRGLFRWRDPDPIEQRFVNICLSKQGYQVIGWR
jgi:hypothetical protein